MLSSKMSERYLYWFYILGLSVYNPRSNGSSKDCTFIRKSIPSICFLLVTILNGVSSFDQFASKKVTLNDCLHAVFIIFMVITGIMAFKRSSFLRGDKYLWKYLIDLEQLISNRLQIDIDFKKFVGCYRRKLICMVLVFSCLVAFKFIHRIRPGNVIRQIGALNLLLITLGVNFHILFYVDLFNFTFETINQHTLKIIETTDTDTFIVNVKKVNFSEQIVHRFQILKLIHFQLWKIVKLMNSDFGTVLTLLIIQNTNTAIQTFYWIIVELYEDDLSKNIRIISEEIILKDKLFSVLYTNVHLMINSLNKFVSTSIYKYMGAENKSCHNDIIIDH